MTDCGVDSVMEKIINKCLVISLILAVGFGAAAYMFRNSPHASEAGGEFTYPLLEYIDLDLQRLDVEIIPYDGEDITVEYKNDRPLEMDTGDNKLSITENADFVVSLFPGKQSEFGLKLYLPRAAYRDITVSTATGDITMTDIDCKSFSAVSESGTMELRGLNGVVRLVSTSGDINADIGVLVDGSDVHCRKGNIHLLVPAESSVAVDFKTKDGEFSTDLISGKVDGDYLYSFNGGKKQISVTAEHGTLFFEERK